MEKEPLLNRGFVLCTMCCFFYTVMFFMFFTGTTSYSQDVLHTSSTVAGVVASLFIVGDMVARILMGRRMNLYGKRRVAIISFSLAAVVSLSYLVVDDLFLFCVVRVIQGYLYGAGASAVSTLVTENLPDSRRGEGLGYFMLSVSLGSAVGPFLCMWMLTNVSYESVFLLGTAVAALAALFVIPVKDAHHEWTAEQVAAMKELRLSNVFDRNALPIAVTAFILFMSYSGVLTFMSSYGEFIGLSGPASVFFVFISASTLISRLFLCRISDKHGDNWAVLPFFILFIIGLFVFSAADSAAMLLGSGFLMGFLIAQFVAVGQAAAVRRVPKERYGVAVSTFNVFLDMSYAVGPMLNGFVIGEMGYRGNYEVMAFVALFALFLYLIVHGIPEHRRSVQ